jgi:hypothetical protein
MRIRKPRAAGPVRGYSREFEVAAGTGARYLLDAIPKPLWHAVKAKARRERRSIRYIILTAFVAYLDD